MLNEIHAGGFTLIANFTINHPEAREDEIFILNDQPDQGGKFSYKDLSFKTKRMGKIAYSEDGQIIADVKPVFINSQELNNSYRQCY